MKHTILIISLILFGLSKLWAQSDYRSGYIIKNNNDTVFGFIDYKGNKSNATKCFFRKDLDSKNQKYTPDDLKAYRFTDGKYYITKQIKSNEKQKTLFLEYLINGKTDIFYYRNKEGEHYLIDIGDGDIHELENVEKEVIIDNVSYIQEKPLYIGLLKISFQDSPTASRKAETVKLSHKSLIKIAHDYHDEVCPDEVCIIYEEKIIKAKVRFGIIGGLSLFALSARESFPDDYYFNNSQFENDFVPSIGIFVKFHLPYINEKLFFQYNLTYRHNYTETNNYYFDDVSNIAYLNYISISQNILHNGLLIKHKLSNKKINPSIIFGGFVDYSFKTNYKRNLETRFATGDIFYKASTTKNPLSNFDFGVSAGIGITSEFIKHREINIDFIYQYGLGLLKGLHTHNFNMKLGLQINK